MITLQSIDVAAALRTLADNIEKGTAIPHGVTVTHGYLEVSFDELIEMGKAQGQLGSPG